MHRFTRHARRGALLLGLVATVAVPPGPAQAADPPTVSVLTRNVYVGTGLDNLARATTFAEFVAAVTQDFNNILATDYGRRAQALATEIQVTRPDAIGLQEAGLLREQLRSDIVAGVPTPNAETVVIDYLRSLLDALRARGIPYVVVSTSVNADAEAPRSNPDSPNGFSDVRLTDRDVILARADIAGRFSDADDGHYVAQFTRGSVGGPLTFTRGWATVDYALGPGRTVRIFNTHLETRDGAAAQVAQSREALAIINASPVPVIALGDYNSAADGSTTATYGELIAGGLADAWTAFQPFNPGRTCCEPELLDRIVAPTERIDLVLTKGPWRTLLAVRTGALPFRLAPPPIWASDHFGVFAVLRAG